MRTRAAADPHTLLAQYVQHLRVCRYSQASIEKASLVLPRLFEHLHARDVRTITEAQILAYLALQRQAKNARSGELLSTSTLVSMANTIRRFFAFLERTGVLLYDPAAQIALPKARALPRDVLSEAQARRLMAAPFPASTIGKRDRAILETLYGSGVRLAELVRCDLSDVDLAQGLLLVKNGKGRKDRLVPLPGRACVALGVYLDGARPELETRSTPALFLSRFGERLGRQAVQILARRHGRALRLHVTPHTLRHSCATHLLQGGADVRHVQLLLGHKHVTTTAIYTRVGVADLRAVLGRSHPRPQAQLRVRAAVTLEDLRDVVLRAHPRHTPDEPAEG